jgi:hypothetical protein
MLIGYLEVGCASVLEILRAGVQMGLTRFDTVMLRYLPALLLTGWLTPRTNALFQKPGR